ncbi:hypothetical protein [Bifidobacterium catenulatum]|uniref:hypothetical protein n=1 Tax=Bifidobacterium TaxID=1678 RepID=UPI0012AC16CF|nr:hypothetical protein [Bifidobacterium catenulatum]
MGKDQGRKAIAIITAITAAVILAGVGGYAYASNSAYDSYKSRVESAKEADSKLVKKIAEAESLVKATKESDVLDKATLTSLNKSLKVGESRKGVPASSHVAKWNLWSVSKAKTIVSNDMTEADDSINAIGKAMGKVEASKTAKQVKDAKDTLDKTVESAESLYKDSEGKVQDDKTRGSLNTAINNAKKASGDKKADVKSLTAINDSLAKAVKAVNDSKDAKVQADAQNQAQEQAQAQSNGTVSRTYSNSGYSNTSGSYSNNGGGSYSGDSNQYAQSQNSNNCTQYGCNGFDYRNYRDSAGAGAKPASPNNYLGTDGEYDYYEFGGDSHGNMW